MGDCDDPARDEKWCRPSVARRSRRRLTHDDQPAGPKQWPGRPQGGFRRAEPAGDDRVGRGGQQLADRGRVGGDDLDPVAHAESPDESMEVVGAAAPAVDENESKVGPGPGDNEPGHSAAASQIDHRPGDVGERVDEGQRMLDDLGERAVTEHPQAL